MHKLVIVATLAAVALGASLANAGPGPNGNNNHGLCTAYFNGSPQGQANKRNAPPFVALAQHVGNNDGIDNDGDDQTDEGDEVATPAGVWDWCSDPANNSKGIGGNPDNPSVAGDEKGNGGGGASAGASAKGEKGRR